MKLDVWEYARLMVQLESRPASRLYQRQREAWQELDAELARLGAEDVVAYSDLMLNAEVDLGALAADEASEVEAALTQAATEIAHMMEGETQPEVRDNLSLERKALLKSAKKAGKARHSS